MIITFGQLIDAVITATQMVNHQRSGCFEIELASIDFEKPNGKRDVLMFTWLCGPRVCFAYSICERDMHSVPAKQLAIEILHVVRASIDSAARNIAPVHPVATQKRQ